MSKIYSNTNGSRFTDEPWRYKGEKWRPAKAANRDAGTMVAVEQRQTKHNAEFARIRSEFQKQYNDIKSTIGKLQEKKQFHKRMFVDCRSDYKRMIQEQQSAVNCQNWTEIGLTVIGNIATALFGATYKGLKAFRTLERMKTSEAASIIRKVSTIVEPTKPMQEAKRALLDKIWNHRSENAKKAIRKGVAELTRDVTKKDLKEPGVEVTVSIAKPFLEDVNKPLLDAAKCIYAWSPLDGDPTVVAKYVIKYYLGEDVDKVKEDHKKVITKMQDTMRKQCDYYEYMAKHAEIILEIMDVEKTILKCRFREEVERRLGYGIICNLDE